ncbi:hypothetical protein GCM10027446_28840 [Angustibacter peucedani]
MPAPTPAAPPRLPMMCALDLDEHPTHAWRDHLVAAGSLVAFVCLAYVLSL